MHKLRWYYNRLKLMSPGEIAWRISSMSQAAGDRIRVPLGLYPSIGSRLGETVLSTVCGGSPVSDVVTGSWAGSAHQDEVSWEQALHKEAGRILEHRMSYLGLDEIGLGPEINWLKDYHSGKVSALKPCPSVDYRDFSTVGDCKLVWEINRHHHLVILARAYKASGDTKYASEVVSQLSSWMRENPFGYGMNWRSPLELAVRLINWVWAVDLIKDSGLIEGEFKDDFLNAVYLHCWDIVRKYSYGSSANNHLVGEAAGVFVASCYFRDLPGADEWREESRNILCREILAQTYADGCIREQALGYQFFVLGFYLISGVIGRNSGDDFSAAYWSRIEKMLEFISALREGGEALPMFGDCDDGYVLDLGDGPHDCSAFLGIGAVLFGRADFAQSAGSYTQTVRWLLGNNGRERFHALLTGTEKRQAKEHEFAESGYYLLQSDSDRTGQRISVVFDCGELGYGSIAAHGHADALSFTMRAFGVEVFIDPGTYDYFTYPEWRNHFRSTRAHNTVTIDGQDQSAMAGPFMWARHARARCLSWEPDENGGRITAEHDGYLRLTDPVIHRRSLLLDGNHDLLEIRDGVLAQGAHDVEIYFHLSEHCVVRQAEEGKVEVRVDGRGTLLLAADSRMNIEICKGNGSPICGWRSLSYHRRIPIHTIRLHGRLSGNAEIVTRINMINTVK